MTNAKERMMIMKMMLTFIPRSMLLGEDVTMIRGLSLESLTHHEQSDVYGDHIQRC